MTLFCSCIILLFLNVFLNVDCYKWNTYVYKQKVDHFSFVNNDNFKQRYLVSMQHWKKGGPVFFYAGNEGDITLFANNTGFMWDIAPEFNAMIVFAEHRYYGKSMPYGKNSYLNKTYLGYLTSEQALADFSDLIVHIKETKKDLEKSRVIVFGGSYGGMLAAWFRMKYPHIVDGAIAASAPILQFAKLTPCENFNLVVTKDFRRANNNCAKVIQKSWDALNGKAKTESGRDWLTKSWQFCKPLKNTKDLNELKEYLTNVWVNLAMVDYPYPSSFLAPLPAYPIKVVCQEIGAKFPSSDNDLLNALFKGVSVYFNFTKTATCLDYSQDASDALGTQGWNFQACTEMVMPMCSDNKNDIFEATPWNFTEYANDCYKKFNVMPRPFMTQNMYGGRDIYAASNIVFSNGLLDPWSSGGVLKNISESVVSVIIPEGAHHLDLRGSDPNDPKSVVEARNLEKRFIKMWIEEKNDFETSKNEF